MEKIKLSVVLRILAKHIALYLAEHGEEYTTLYAVSASIYDGTFRPENFLE